jgi:hypothetical protein
MLKKLKIYLKQLLGIYELETQLKKVSVKTDQESKSIKVMVKQTVIDVLNILEEKGDSYIDPAEHIYDAVKVIKRYINDDDLISHIDDFIWGLSSSANGDFDGTLGECIKMLRTLKK